MADNTTQYRRADAALAAAIRAAILTNRDTLPSTSVRLWWSTQFGYDQRGQSAVSDDAMAATLRQALQHDPLFVNGTHMAVDDPAIRVLFRGYAAWADDSAQPAQQQATSRDGPPPGGNATGAQPQQQQQQQQQASGYVGTFGQDYDPDTSPRLQSTGLQGQQPQTRTPIPSRTRNDATGQGPTPVTSNRSQQAQQGQQTPGNPALAATQGPTPATSRTTGQQLPQQTTPAGNMQLPLDVDQTTFPIPPSTTQQQRQRRPPPEGSVDSPARPGLGSFSRAGDPLSAWRRQYQPDTATRVRQLLNWVRDEDVDRRPDFAREAREAADWIDDQLRDGVVHDDNTRRLLLEARRAIAVHNVFEGHHYQRTMRTGSFVAPAVPTYAPRLPYRSDMPLELGNAGPRHRVQRDLPDTDQVTPRPWGLVNDMWTTAAERLMIPRMRRTRGDRINTMAWDESRLWENNIDEDNGGLTANMAWRENKAYEDCIDVDNVGLEGWTRWGTDDQGNTNRRIFNGDILGSGEVSFALERGARRAGLQAALRQMRSVENQRAAAAMGDAGGMLLLPGGTAGDFVVHDEQALRRQAGLGDDGPPLTVASLPANQLQSTQGKRDPQGFISNMAQFWRNMRPHMANAREAVMATDAGRGRRAAGDNQGLTTAGGDWVQPPESVFGPYVWRGVDGETQVEQDLLRQMRGLRRLFDRERSIADRTLLRDMEAHYQRGLLGDYDNRPANMLPARDLRTRSDGTVGWRFVDEMELEWIRFLLNPGSKPEMLRDLLPRTKLFIQFAERLNRLFMDPGCDLFPTANTFVGIEDLIQAMAKLDGPVRRITFYPYDVKMFLERLAHQGRCQYVEDWRLYGRVARPVFQHFPEHLVAWRELADDELDFEGHPEDMVFAPRMDETRSWAAVVNQPAQLDQRVANYFHCLAFRWGATMRSFQRREANGWQMHDAAGVAVRQLPVAQMHRTLDRFEYAFRISSGWDVNSPNFVQNDAGLPAGEADILDSVNGPLVDVVNATLDTSLRPAAAANVTTREALQTIRTGIIDECVRNDNLLFAGRTTDYRDPNAPRTRGSLWSWARPAVRGQVKRFFGMDRWPLNLQSQATQQRIQSCVDDDPQFRWSVYLEDPTPWSYYRPKARPYTNDRIKLRSGFRDFPIGDTARQKMVVTNNIIATVARNTALGGDDDHAAVQAPVRAGRVASLLRRLQSSVSLKRKRAEVVDADDHHNDDDDGTDAIPRPPKLPRLQRSAVPVSRDLVGEAVAERRVQVDATRARTALATDVADMDGVTDVTAQRPVPAGPGLRIEANFPLMETRRPPAAAAA